MPNTITYNAVISAFGKGKQAEPALVIFKEVQGYGIVPNTITNDALISALEKGKHSERALEIIKALRSA